MTGIRATVGRATRELPLGSRFNLAELGEKWRRALLEPDEAARAGAGRTGEWRGNLRPPLP